MSEDVMHLPDGLGDAYRPEILTLDVDAAFGEIVDQLSGLPEATVAALDSEFRGKPWGGKDANYLDKE